MLKIRPYEAHPDKHQWLAVNQAWNKELTDYIKENGIDAVSLSYTSGWEGDNLDFLADLKGLKRFTLIDWQIRNIEGINVLTNIEQLNIQAYNSKSKLDFTRFPMLKECRVRLPNHESLFKCGSIEKLYLDGFFKSESFQPLAKLQNLRDLSVVNTNKIKSTSGIESLKNLKWLMLAYLPKLASLEGIGSLSELEILEMNTCKKIADVNVISKNRKLKKLWLENMGDIDSLKPLEHNTNLNELVFIKTNILDGALDFIHKLPNITHVSFNNKKHYSHKNEEFKKKEN